MAEDVLADPARVLVVERRRSRFVQVRSSWRADGEAEGERAADSGVGDRVAEEVACGSGDGGGGGLEEVSDRLDRPMRATAAAATLVVVV